MILVFFRIGLPYPILGLFVIGGKRFLRQTCMNHGKVRPPNPMFFLSPDRKNFNQCKKVQMGEHKIPHGILSGKNPGILLVMALPGDKNDRHSQNWGPRVKKE